MAGADGKVFELLADEPGRELLRVLLQERRPQTQRELAALLGFNSSTISRRMAELEEFGLVSRASPHAPYEVEFRDETYGLLIAAAALTSAVAQRRADETARYEAELRNESSGRARLRPVTEDG
jgi:DNA-binding Lrp family transcriptional regulator